MTIKYQELFKPFKIGKVEIKNRIVMSPMLPAGWLDDKKAFTNETIAYFEERAKGGAGLIYTGASFPNAGLEHADFNRSPFAYPEHFVMQAKKLADAVHKYGSKLFIQMQLGSGRTAFPSPSGPAPVAPSAVANRWDPSVECRELTTDEIHRLIESTIEAAVLCKQAGADGVDINGVKGGYIGDQFATAAFNHRTDEYGGGLEGRVRLIVEIVRGIKERCGEDFPVTTRLGTKAHMKAEGQAQLPGEEYTEFGRDIEESIEIGKMLEKAGFDAILFGTGTYDSLYWLYPPMYMEDGCWLDEVRVLKEALNIPIICPGKMSEPEIANKAIKDGVIDAVGIGRGLVADPEWPNKVKSGKDEEVRPCIYCNIGCLGRVLGGLNMQCSVNSDVFGEKEVPVKYAKADKAKKVAIIGGGISGMEAARVAAIRGHQVTIYEKNIALGGLMIPASVPQFKKHDQKLLDWFERQMENLGVEIKLNTKLNAEDVLALDADEIIIATGSTPRSLPVPGSDQENVMSAADVLMGKELPGKKVVLVGGGQVGCETAIWLQEKGYEVTLVEGLDELMAAGADPMPFPNKHMLTDLLAFHQIPVYLGTTVKEITENGVVISGKDGETVLDTDSVVISIGYRPNDDLFKEVYSASEKKVWLLGDAKVPANIMMAVRDGSAIGALI